MTCPAQKRALHGKLLLQLIRPIQEVELLRLSQRTRMVPIFQLSEAERVRVAATLVRAHSQHSSKVLLWLICYKQPSIVPSQELELLRLSQRTCMVPISQLSEAERVSLVVTCQHAPHRSTNARQRCGS